ncbi:MAG: hypothetical protein P8R36_04225 [Actinomycetota bacterium]|nr:hypothetical protein [Actinomycetota bacterium]
MREEQQVLNRYRLNLLGRLTDPKFCKQLVWRLQMAESKALDPVPYPGEGQQFPLFPELVTAHQPDKKQHLPQEQVLS